MYVTDVGEQRSIPLGSASTAQMNTDSVLWLRREGKAIHAELLRGEVAFDLRQNWGGRLVVSAGGLEIRDIGTVFSVHMGDDGRVRITVVKGRVILSAVHIPETTVTQNEQAIVDSRDHPMSLKKKTSPATAIEDQLAWRYGELRFHCESISTASEEFNRYNSDKIVVVDDASTPARLEGIFMATDPLAFVQSIQVLVPGLRVETEDAFDGHRIFRLRHLPPKLQPRAADTVPERPCG
jgi:transmembrane sensor